MRNTKSLEIKVGIVSLIAVILLVVGISLTSKVNLSPDSKILKIKFPNSVGIKTSNPITINGLESGYVDNVTLTDGGVIVDAVINSTVPIKEDAKAIILLKEITGGKYIEISPGKSNKLFDYKNLLQGEPSTDIGDLVAILGNVSGDAVSLLRRLDTLTYEVNSLLQDEALISKIKNSINNLDTILNSTKQFISQNKYKLNNTIENLENITSNTDEIITTNKENINLVFDNLIKLSNKIDNFLNKTDLTVDEVNKILNDINLLTNNINNSNNVISMIVNDEEFAKDFDSAIKNLKELLEKLDKHGVNVNVRLGTRP